MRAGAFVRALPDHSLLDRVVRGRAWIPLLGVMLAGIVAMQVEVLKLGASIGRSLERGSALQTRNQSLRASVAGLADEQRIERLAAGMGMVMPAPADVGFLSAPGDASVSHALANVHAPDPSAFSTLQTSNGAVVTGINQGAASSLGGVATPTTASSSATSTAPSTSSSTAGSTQGQSAPPTQTVPTQTVPTQTAPTQAATPVQSGGAPASSQTSSPSQTASGGQASSPTQGTAPTQTGTPSGGVSATGG